MKTRQCENHEMNIAIALKAEITRVARKEVRVEVQALKKASSSYRTDIAALKRRVVQLERLVAQLGKRTPKKAPLPFADDQQARAVRYSAKTLVVQRQRLGLSAAELGAILGVSGQSIYKWEDGKAKPRAKVLPAIANLRKLGKKEIAAKLAELK